MNIEEEFKAFIKREYSHTCMGGETYLDLWQAFQEGYNKGVALGRDDC